MHISKCSTTQNTLHDISLPKNELQYIRVFGSNRLNNANGNL